MQQETATAADNFYISNNPPDLDEIAGVGGGRYRTHCYNGSRTVFYDAGRRLRALGDTSAGARRVRLDVGAGTASLSFAVAKRAISTGIFTAYHQFRYLLP